jgi:cytochrome P450
VSAGTETFPFYGALMTTSDILTVHTEVLAVLTDPAFVVPQVPNNCRPGGIVWLRNTVSRFSAETDHRRRRSLILDELAKVDLADLGQMASERTTVSLKSGHGPVDVMAKIARVVPVELLAEALSLPAGMSEDVNIVAAAYHPRSDFSATADQSVARLVKVCGGIADETAAARIGLLVQACDATAGLIGNALIAMKRQKPTASASAILAETLLLNPPVRATRRQATTTTRVGNSDILAGEIVTLELAGSLAFGAGPRKCPGSEHAFAIAGGIVEALRGWQLVDDQIEYEPSPNLRVPASLLVR